MLKQNKKKERLKVACHGTERGGTGVLTLLTGVEAGCRLLEKQ